jgi:hypothetical protein
VIGRRFGLAVGDEFLERALAGLRGLTRSRLDIRQSAPTGANILEPERELGVQRQLHAKTAD